MLAVGEGHTWADIGCGPGLMSRLVSEKGYDTTGYDLDANSIRLARYLGRGHNNVRYRQQDLFTIDRHFNVISATSLLSVIPDKKKALKRLLSLLSPTNATLILIEPTEDMKIKNVWRLIKDTKRLFYYLGLLLWAKAREGKHIDRTLFEDLSGVEVSHVLSLDGMVRITYIRSKR